jgi:hypothetical protein
MPTRSPTRIADSRRNSTPLRVSFNSHGHCTFSRRAPHHLDGGRASWQGTCCSQRRASLTPSRGGSICVASGEEPKAYNEVSCEQRGGGNGGGMATSQSWKRWRGQLLPEIFFLYSEESGSHWRLLVFYTKIVGLMALRSRFYDVGRVAPKDSLNGPSRIRLVSVVVWLYLTLVHVTSAFSLPFV